MMNKQSVVAIVAIISTIGLTYFLNKSHNKPNTSAYKLLAIADHEKLASANFKNQMIFNLPVENSIFKQTEKSSIANISSSRNLSAPAIRAVAIAKFLNGNLPNITPSGSLGIPALLSQTGAFTNLINLTPSPGLIPYDMIEPFWSDGATKKRWMAIPNDGSYNTIEEQIQFSQDNAWDFPRGTVLIKHFEFPGNRLETRFEVKGDDDVYYYLTYKWNAAQTDAILLNESVDENIVVNGITQSWHYPSRNECASCHFPQNGSVLGPKTRNLNKAITYPSTGITMNQLVNLSELGILTENITNANASSYPAVAAKNDLSASLEVRARSYIDVNCASCHNPTVDNIAMFDARFSTPLEDQNIIYGDVIYDEGLNNPKVIIPQDVSNSMAHFRLNSTQIGIEMPPISKDVVDIEGVQLIADWISSLSPATTSPPVAAFSASTTNGSAPLAVDFDASASADADNDTLTFTWDFGDGNTSQGQTTNHVYTNSGSYIAILSVSDGQFSDQEVATIVVNNSNPGGDTVSFTDGTNLIAQDNFSGLPMGVIDMNGDGKDDIVQFNSARNLRIQYQNGSGETFTTFNHGQVSSNNQWGTAIADFDQNGYNDIMSGGAYDNLKIIRNSNGNDSYAQTNLPNSNIFLQGANFVDINNDGWADIFACHDDAESRAYQNNQDGTFSFNADLISTETVPTSDNSGNYASMWMDYDNDGDLDLYISKCRGGVTSSSDPRRINMLWQNDGNNNFMEVAEQANLKIGDQTWLSDFGDIDNDGDLDAIVINHGTGPNLMRNNGNGTFTEVTSGSGLLPTLQPLDFYGIQGFFKDFNNDGYIDLMVSGDNHYIFYNNGDGTFQNATNPFNSNQIQSFSVGDINHDGFLDIYAGYANGLNSPSSTKDRIWLNDGNSNNYLNIKLKGTQSNINGIGARVELYGAWGKQIRDVRSGEGYGLVNSYTQHFGIGVNTQVEKVVVRWPSGNVDEILNPSINQFLQITETLPAPTCSDGIQNGDETGIDCGGSCATICPCEGEDLVTINFENGTAPWATSGNASTGTFVIADPTAQSTSGVQSQPEDDHSPVGTNALITATNTSVGADDIDGGTVSATSPTYNIEEDSNVSIWYFFGQRDAGDDAGDFFLLEYSINGGASYTTLASYGDERVLAQWTEATTEIPAGSNLVIRVSAADGPAVGDIVEAGIDDLVVTSICVDPILVTGVTVSPDSVILTEGDTQQLNATVSPTDATDPSVVWSSSNTDIATVDSNGEVSAVAPGTVTITAATTDGNFIATSLLTVNAIPVPVTGVSLNLNTATIVEGNIQQLVATVFPSNADDLTVSWFSSDTEIAMVTSNGLVAGISDGIATITVTTNDGNFSASSEIIVEASTISVTGITIEPTSSSLFIGDNLQLNTTVVPSDASDQSVNWSSTNAAIATVDANGLVTAITAGSVTITARTTDGNLTAETTITTTSNACTASGTILMERYDDISGNELENLFSANNYPDNPSISSELSLFETPRNMGDNYGVRVSGYLCAPESGTYYFWVAANNHAELNLSSDADEANKVRISYHEDYVSNREWDKFPNQKSIGIVLSQGDTYYIEAIMKEGTFGDNLAVGWRKPSDGDGLLASEVIPGNMLSPSVRDVIDVTGVSLVPSNLTIPQTATAVLNANIVPSNASNSAIDWSTANSTIATVDQNGIVTGISEGTTTITATTNDGDFTATAVIEVTSENPNACTATGSILMERYDNISGNAISDLLNSPNYPENPSTISELSLFEISRNAADNYGARVSGYLCAPETGTYYFWIAANNHAELNLSTSSDEADKVRVAHHEDYAGNREWDKFNTQKSLGIFLTQGDNYYIEALMKEGTFGDNLAVAWRIPSQGNGSLPTEVIPGNVLSPSVRDVISVSGVALTPENIILNEDATITLNENTIPLNATNRNVTWSSNNETIATISDTGLVTGISVGTTIISVITEDGGFTAETVVEIIPAITNTCTATGTILMERYDDISGIEITNLLNAINYPDNPSLVSELSLFEIPRNAADNYGVRVSGYLCAPETGTYYFWVAGNNHSEINLSTSSDPDDKVRISYHEEYASNREWDKFTTQKSQGIFLNQGETYYVEALMKEGTFGDNLAVGWRKPSDGDASIPSEVIPGSVLSASLTSAGTTLRASVTPSSMLSLSPVPATSTLTVMYFFIDTSDTAIELTVFDNLGRQMINSTFTQDTFNGQIDVSQLPAGAYFLRLVKGEEILNKRFTVRQ